MKPSFALTLSNDRVGLLHRTPKGWMPVGDTPFGGPDFEAALDYLRSSALGLSPKGITTKLVIPNSEILYLEIEAPGPDATTRRRQIRKALAGKTPYDPEELVFDWWGKGPVVQVAVVWKGTLEEAEGFADQQRFNPVSFVATPEPGQFKGEPYFGVTKVSATILSAGEKVERDQDPIALLARELPRAETAVAGAAPEAVVVAEAAAIPAEVEPAPVTEPEAPAAEAEAPPVEVAPRPVPPIPEFRPRPTAPAATPVVAEPVPPAPVVAAPVAPEAVTVPVPPVAEPLPEPVTEASKPATDEAPMALDVTDDGIDGPVDDIPPMPAGLGAARRGPVTAAPAVEPGAIPAGLGGARRPATPPVAAAPVTGRSLPRDEDDLPPPPSAAALAAFSSRRQPEAAARPVTPPARGILSDGPNSFRPPVDRPAAAKPVGKAVEAAPAPRPVPRAEERALKGINTPVTAPTIPGTRKSRRVESMPTADGAPPPAPARPSRAAPGALGSKPLPVRGKPRYLGLILTAILLVLLALVAALSSYYVARNETAEPGPVVAESTAPAAAEPSAEEIAAMNAAEAEADGVALDETAAPEPAAEVTAVAAPEAAVELALPDADASAEATPAAPAPEASEAVAAETLAPAPVAPEAEIAEVAGPAPETPIGTAAEAAPALAEDPQDEIYLAAMDAPPDAPDPAALPAPVAAKDAAPGFQMPPPAFGTVYQFDAQGMVVPTEEGILTPDGAFVIAGKPERLPPGRPATVTAEAERLAAEVAAQQAAAQQAAGAEPGATAPGAIAAGTAVTDAAIPPPLQTFEADPSLSGFRPQDRPADLATPAAAAGDDASLAPAADSRFASLRPRARASSPLAPAPEAETAAAASLVDTGGTALAVAVSMRPEPRPRDLSRAVEAAVAAAVRQPEPQAEPEPEPAPAPVQVAAAQPPAKAAKPAKAQPADPEHEEEPEVDNSRDRSPRLSGTVAKQATFVNALNMSKTALIGVYGTPSKRYALIRTSNGRYKKVKVGDSVDGGKVAAISQSEVTYQKGGRSYTLTLPQG